MSRKNRRYKARVKRRQKLDKTEDESGVEITEVRREGGEEA